MDEQWLTHDIAHDPVDDLDRMLRRAQLEIPRARTVGPGQLDPVAIEPDDEDLRLDGAIDVPTHRLPAHVPPQGLGCVRCPAGRGQNRCRRPRPPPRAPRPTARAPGAGTAATSA